MSDSIFDWSDEITNWSILGSKHIECITADKFNRACYAKFLTNYLSAGGENRSFVLNLNAEWGAGKTWFIKRWYHSVKNTYPSVYIDAWQQDFSNDPLLAVVSSIIDQLKNISGDLPNIRPEFSQKIFKLLKSTSKIVAKSALKSVHIDIDGIDLSISDDDVSDIVDTLCTSHKEQYDAIQEIKKDIYEWIHSCRGKKQLIFPAFIFIDELDRCRPSYAVEMLETIKHIFDIPGIVFVVATDTEQLQHAIKAIYGENFDARSYLSRFFRRRFSLHSISRFDFIEDKVQSQPYTLPLDCYWPTTGQTEKIPSQLIEIIAVTSDILDLSLRQTEQLIDQVTAIILNNIEPSFKINLVLLTFLCAVHEKHHDVYLNIMNNKPTVDLNGVPVDIGVWLNQFKKKDISIYLQPMKTIGREIFEHYDYSNFHGIRITVTNPFLDSEYKVNYGILISSLISFYQTPPNPSSLHTDIYRFASASLSSRESMNSGIIPKIVQYELIESHHFIYFYRNLVELATSFD